LNILALLVAMLSGALAAVVVCKAIRLRLFVELWALVGCLVACWVADKLASDGLWIAVGILGGFAWVVIWLRRRQA
jgi:hypothetical protein